ncbi:hypothetical protein [Aureibacter tunicatorum]|uniref:Uncharacterized protein n=1 Tax=Aureibacter tunicatorum TaxID=866807 RepID=A0AAE4BS87_9BACT|nr:hypothetical protein [Aureibacter tunicatorum]MDR6238107.1 hypothetical protein [Aureibacter tunicatorum]BDD03140.1 hypothetical protein AUTU_06230 [Aureibacter tunicatorum]
MQRVASSSTYGGDHVYQRAMVDVINGGMPIQRKVYLDNSLEPLKSYEGLPSGLNLKLIQYTTDKESMEASDREIAAKLYDIFHSDMSFRIPGDASWDFVKSMLSLPLGDEVAMNFQRGDLFAGEGYEKHEASIKRHFPGAKADYLSIEALMKRFDIDGEIQDFDSFNRRITNIVTLMNLRIKEKDPNFIKTLTSLNTNLVKRRVRKDANHVKNAMISFRIKNGDTLHFELNGTNDAEVIRHLVAQDDNYPPQSPNAILHYLYEAKFTCSGLEDIDGSVKFYRNGRMVRAPWDDSPELWALAEKKRLPEVGASGGSVMGYEVLGWDDLGDEEAPMLSPIQQARRSVVIMRDRLDRYTDEQLIRGFDRKGDALEETAWKVPDHSLIASQFGRDEEHRKQILERLNSATTLAKQQMESASMEEKWSKKKEKKRSSSSKAVAESRMRQFEVSQINNPQPRGTGDDDL